MNTKHEYLAGVDEAGRGPLAGPVAVGAVMVAQRDILRVRRKFPDARDSKQMTPAAREDCLARMEECARQGIMRFSVACAGHKVIDTHGIVFAIQTALNRAVYRIAPDSGSVHVLLDGGLKAPRVFSQTTIVRGDETELLISLASIAAKVRRDAMMVRRGGEYPEYGFAEHKGYGTKHHYEALRKHGLSPLHRRSFLHGHISKLDK